MLLSSQENGADVLSFAFVATSCEITRMMNEC